MSNSKTSTGAAASSSTDPKKQIQKEPTFPLARLAKDCYEIFGITPSTFHGATCKLPSDHKMTIVEMESHIKTWLNTPLKLGGTSSIGKKVT